MLKSVEGVIRDGRIELLEPAPQSDGRVLVTFLPSREEVRLKDHGIDESQAANLRQRLSTISGDWDSTEMDVYDEI